MQMHRSLGEDQREEQNPVSVLCRRFACLGGKEEKEHLRRSELNILSAPDTMREDVDT